VTDDGCGFTPDEHASSSSGEHLGLLTMRERAERVRGRLGIASSPGNGTTIHTTIPLAD
jgi:signal transduction histidine kinase